jgi:hypothetical protein
MHIKGMLSLGAVLVAAVALVSVSGAGTTSARSAKAIDVSTRASVVHYLRAIHINPRGVVIQRGARNYAGPNCPGKGWTCTSTAHPVVQVAPASGKNTFQCSGARCAVVQAAEAPLATNTAKCVKTTGASQSCSINQVSASANNVAIVYQSVVKTTGLTQNAVQTAQIVQRATGGATVQNGNTACVSQTMLVSTSTVANRGTPVLATLDGHQTLSIKQDSANGANRADQSATTTNGGSCDTNPLHDRMIQSQTISQTATGSARITQLENTANSGPNLSLDIAQNQSDGFGETSGTNKAAFSQDNALTAIAKTPVGPVIQTQSSANGGLQAKINQFSHDVSTASAKQTETQCEHAEAAGALTCDTPHPPTYSFTQTQFGPVRKGGCCSVQGDNADDVFTIEQHTTQDNDSGNNQTNIVQADCQTSGGCTAAQEADIDGQHSQNTQAGQNVNTEMNCTGSSCTETCTGSSCTTFTIDGPQLSASNINVAEFGFGGMRTNGTGSIAVSGVTGPVARAILYWNGPTNSTDPAANAAVTFNGTPVTGTNIGFASDNCFWGFQNSQSYQADVTGLVTGNGTYSLSNFRVPPDVEINGVSLVVFYNDTDTSNDRNVVLWSGNDSNVTTGPPYADDGWDETLTGVQYPGSGSASLDFIVSDGQYDGTLTFQDGELDVNGNTFVPQGDIFSGDSTPAGSFNSNGDLWDVKSFNGLESFLVAGSNTIQLTSPHFSDCLSLVALAANVPASAPIAGPSSQQQQSQAPTHETRPLPLRSVPGGAVVRKPGASG